MGRLAAQTVTDKQVLAAVKERGDVENAARELGLAPSTLRSRIKRSPKLQKDIAEVRQEFQAAEREKRRQALVAAGDVAHVSEEDKLRERNADLEKALRTARKTSTAEALMLERFTAAFANVKPRYSPLAIPKAHRAKDEHEHVLLFSDAHANEVVSREETMGLNEFNWRIMLERMNRVQQAVLSFQENRPYPIKKLHVHALGDNISGDIHEELEVTNELPHEESVVQMGLDTAAWLEEFVPYYESISVAGCVGNHPRRKKKPTAKSAFNNSDWTMYRFIETYLRNNPAFDFYFPKSKMAAVTVAERWRILLLHGDGIRSTMVDVPWGGIIRYLGKLARQFSQAGDPIDYFELGHWHQANALGAGGPGTKTFINGTIKGPDEYSVERFGGGDPPQQVLLTFHRKRGVTDVSYLDCEGRVPANEIPRRNP